MSMKSDIDSDFDEMIRRWPALEQTFNELRFNVYASLEWEDAAKGVVEYCKEKGIAVTVGMEAYAKEQEQ